MLISIECMRRRYISAAGDGALGVNGYQDAITGETFPREYYLVRGEDTPVHRQWVADVAAVLIERQQPCVSAKRRRSTALESS